jgi:hypothetical protein
MALFFEKKKEIKNKVILEVFNRQQHEQQRKRNVRFLYLAFSV